MRVHIFFFMLVTASDYIYSVKSLGYCLAVFWKFFLCPADIVRRALCFWLSFQVPAVHQLVSNSVSFAHYLCQFYTYLLATLHTHYLCLSSGTYWFSGHQVKGQGDGDRFCENRFRPGVSHCGFRSLSLSLLQMSYWDFRYCYEGVV